VPAMCTWLAVYLGTVLVHPSTLYCLEDEGTLLGLPTSSSSTWYLVCLGGVLRYCHAWQCLGAPPPYSTNQVPAGTRASRYWLALVLVAAQLLGQC